MSAALVAVLLSLASPAVAQVACGSVALDEAVDIRRLDVRGRRVLGHVEKFHFPGSVEALTKGATGAIGADIGFVLYYVPNHYRALDAMARLGIKEKKATPNGAALSVDCYFERAARFAPDDGRVRLVHGIYLAKMGKANDALAKYQEAEKMMPDSLNVAYNLGLLHFEMKNYERSLDYAKKAYGGGITLPGLKSKLAEAGKWPANLVIAPTAPRAVKPPQQQAADAPADVPPAAKTTQESPVKAREGEPAPR